MSSLTIVLFATCCSLFAIQKADNKTLLNRKI